MRAFANPPSIPIDSRPDHRRVDGEREREKPPLTMTADVEISDKLSAGGEEQRGVGEERSGDVHTPSLKDSTNYSNDRYSVGKMARIEHPEAPVKSFNAPFSLECKGCESTFAKGVSVNAEKKLVGNSHGKKDSTNYSSGRHSVGKRERIEHPEALVKRSSWHHHSRQKEREREVPLMMTADLEISGEKSAGGEEESAVGEEQYADVDMLSLEDSTNYSSGRHSVGKRARIEHPEVLVISFKVPFSLECKGCESVIAKGVRINAEKKLVGNYHGKKIWSFIFECVNCGRKIVMERVSNACKYEVMRGAREKSARHHQGKEEPVRRRYFSVSEAEQQPEYRGWGVFPCTDLENQFPFLPLYALVNVKSQR